MSYDLNRRRISDSVGRKPPKHISRLSTNISLEETAEFLTQKLAPHTTRHSDRSFSAPKTIKLRFQVQANTKFGCCVGLVGNIMELGRWKLDSKVTLETKPGEYPKWTSREITLLIPANTIELEYKYIYIEQNGACRWEQCRENRKIELKLFFTNSLTVTILDVIDSSQLHVMDSRQGLPALQSLTELGTFYDHTRSLCDYAQNKAERMTLQDYLALAHFFRYISSTQRESESMHVRMCLLKLAVYVLQFSTKEIEPIVRDIFSGMAACSAPIRKMMQTITKRSSVEKNQVPLGCDSPSFFEVLSELFNHSSEECMARALTINSVRKSLQGLGDRSTHPELLMFYDIWLEETQAKDIEEHFLSAGAANVYSEIHKLTIVLESLELSSICSYELSTIRLSLETIWQSHNECKEYLESLKAVLLALLEVLLNWLSKYSNPEALSHMVDYIGMKDTLAAIGSRYVHLLLPILSKTLKYIDHLTQVEHFIPLLKGTAVGKVVKVRAFSEIPSIYASVIAILSETPMNNCVPESVKALVLLTDIPLDSKLVSFCHTRKVVLAVTSERLVPENLDQCVQVQVFDDRIEFL